MPVKTVYSNYGVNLNKTWYPLPKMEKQFLAHVQRCIDKGRV